MWGIAWNSQGQTATGGTLQDVEYYQGLTCLWVDWVYELSSWLVDKLIGWLAKSLNDQLWGSFRKKQTNNQTKKNHETDHYCNGNHCGYTKLLLVITGKNFKNQIPGIVKKVSKIPNNKNQASNKIQYLNFKITP